MANQFHLEMLLQGPDSWNEWRRNNSGVRPDLSEANLLNADLSRAVLDGADLRGSDLSKAQLSHASLHGANLEGATLSLADLLGAVLNEANLCGASFFGALLFGTRLKTANLSGANLLGSTLMGADLSGADLSGAHLMGANFHEANLEDANLEGANLTAALLVGTRIEGARFVNCSVHGISAWNLDGEAAVQQGLCVTPKGEPRILVDSLEHAIFVNLLLDTRQMRDLVAGACGNVALCVGRRRSDSLNLLPELMRLLSEEGYLPILFDVDHSFVKKGLEMLKTLGKFSKLLIADLTGILSGAAILGQLSEAAPHLFIQPLVRPSGKSVESGSLNPQGRLHPLIEYQSREELFRRLDLQSLCRSEEP